MAAAPTQSAVEMVAKLASGRSMHRLAFGFGTAFYHAGAEKSEALKTALADALDIGFTHLDHAEMYRNQEIAGEALRDYFATGGSGRPSRANVFITSKVANTSRSAAGVRESLLTTLSQLHVDKLDLFLIHSPFQLTVPLSETWAAMEKLVDDGLVTDIGVSNFRVSDLEELLKIARIPPVVNQIECHPYCFNRTLSEYCQSKGILICSYSPLAPLVHFAGGPVDAPVAAAAARLQVSPAQVLLAWNLSQGHAVVTLTSKKQRMVETLQVGGIVLDPAEVEAITTAGASSPARAYWTKEDWSA